MHNGAMDTFKTIEDAWHYVVSRHQRDPHGIHGPLHWAVVERNALYLAEKNNVNPTLVSLFALFHDSCRVNDNHDPEHGPRAAVYALELREQVQGLLPDDANFERLLEACKGHTQIIHHKDPAIAVCWDADRLDLGRVGIAPHPKYLNTDEAKALASTADLSPLLQRAPRPVDLIVRLYPNE